MSVQTQKRLYTGQELYEINSQGGQQYELADGELVEVSPVNFKHGKLAVKIAARLLEFIEQQQIGGEALTETGYILRHDPDLVSGPDVSLIGNAKVQIAERTPEGYLDFAPDLAVEVVSPGGRPGAIFEKLYHYVNAGVPLIWLVFPVHEVVNVVRPGEPILMLSRQNDDVLEGYEVLPSLKLPLTSIF